MQFGIPDDTLDICHIEELMGLNCSLLADIGDHFPSPGTNTSSFSVMDLPELLHTAQVSFSHLDLGPQALGTPPTPELATSIVRFPR